MGDGLIATLMLLCAIVASLAIGVLLAQAVCVAAFAVFQNHAEQVAAARIPAPPASTLEAVNS